MTVMDSATFWNTLSEARGLGPKTLASIALALKGAGLSGESVSPEQIHELGLRASMSSKIEEALANPLSPEEPPDGVQLLTPDHFLFPIERLKRSIPIPVLLYLRGNVRLLHAPGLSISGSRHAHPRAIEYAEKIAETAAMKGWNVVSGLAAGIDQAAHHGALHVEGTTTAVLAEGISRKKLNGEMSRDSYLIVSQFRPSAPWTAHNAMKRNATIAALAEAVVVVVAGIKGGSWEQAQLCLKEGIPLRVPDFSTDIAEGNRVLIQAGAVPLDPESPEDILQLLKAGKAEAASLL